MESSLPTTTPAEYALLLDSQALGESILKRHLTDLNSRPEPPTTEAVTCAILSLRRTTNNRRMLMLMINPDAFRRTPRDSSLTHTPTHTQGDDPSPHVTPRAWRHTKTFYPDPNFSDPTRDDDFSSPTRNLARARNRNSDFESSDPVDLLDPVILSRKSPSDFSNSSFAIRNSPPPIAVHANPYLLNPNADDDYDPNDDFDPELDADLTSDSGDPSDPVDPLNSGILSKDSSSSSSVSSVAPCEISSDSVDPVILSKSSSSASALSAPLRENSASSQSLFGLSPEASKTVAAILEPLRNAPRQLRPVPKKYEGMTIEEYNAYRDFNDSGRPMDYLKPEIVAQNKRYNDYIYRDRSLDPKPESPNPANPSSNSGILSKNSSTNSPPSREKTSSKSPTPKFNLQDFLARARADAVDKSLGNGLDPPITS